MFGKHDARITNWRTLLSGITHVLPGDAITVTQAGSGVGDASAGAQPGHVWVLRENELVPVQALTNGKIGPSAGNNITVGQKRRGGQLEVIDANYRANLSAYGAAVAAALGQPQIAPELSQQLIPLANVQDLRVRWPDAAFAGLFICVEAGLTPYGYSLKQHVDISSYRPSSAGTRWWVLVYQDSAGTIQFSTTGSTATTKSADQMLLDSGGVSGIGALENLTITAGWIPLAGVVLEQGQTTITPANTRMVSWRFAFGSEPGVGGTLAGLTDVDVTSPSDGDVLTYVTADGKWENQAPSGGGGLTLTDYGTTTTGGSNEAPTGNKIYYKQITPSTDGWIGGIRVRIHGDGTHVNNLGAAIYDDNAGVPGNVIAMGNFLSSASVTLKMSSTYRVFNIPIAYRASASTPIWLAVFLSPQVASALTLDYASGGGDYTLSPSGNLWPDASIETPSSGSNNYSIACTLEH